jgi:hypothetical protein
MFLSYVPLIMRGCIALGVRGHTFKKDGDIYIPLIIAEHEGSGDLDRFLDQLPTHCVVVSVTEPHLENMLVRRGFIKKMLSNGEDEWRRPAIRAHLYRNEQYSEHPVRAIP